jgi:hypothetical protein
VPNREFRERLEAFGRAEFANYSYDITLVGVYLLIEIAHIGLGDFSGEVAERGAELREAFQGRFANDRDRVVWRKVVAIVLQRNEAEGLNQAVG